MEKQLNDLYQKIINFNEAEDNVKSDISSVLSLIDDNDDWEKEYQTTNGPCDIISFSNKIIIETKRRGYINVDEDKDQLLKYLNGVVPIYDNGLWNKGSCIVWRGILTDGRQWTCWDYDRDNRELREVSMSEEFNDPELIHHYIQNRIYNRWQGIEKIRIPSKTNLLEKHFKPIFKKITNTVKAEKLESKVEYATKLGVWRIVLKGAGVVPDVPGSLEADIFWRHSFIVSASRMIINHLDNPTISKEKLLRTIDNGFHAWLLENRKTKKIMLELASEIQKYQWNFYSQDVLKYLYHALTPEDQRKEFGEFYTPDYLAKEVIEQVLDDQWLDESIERAYQLISGKFTPPQKIDHYLGVLDPSCGSGTFLLQSALHIKDRIRKKHRDKLADASKIIARLVHGIDVHPIAVEMSKATLRAVLTDSLNPNEYRICLGSSLNEREKEQGLFIVIETPKSTINISESLYNHPRFTEVVSRINQAIAVDSNAVYFSDLEASIKNQAIDLYKDLKEVVKKEGNHVWEWLILNNIYLNKLFKNGVGRMVGNPPWLVQNNAQESIRKALYKQIAKEEGVYSKTRGYLANVDLACAFSARTIRLYLPKKGGGYGWVLPQSPIIGQAWQRWREGHWRHVKVQHREMWDLSDVDPPIFAHAPNGCSVVLGETTDEKVESLAHKVFHYSGNYWGNPIIKEIQSIRFIRSAYFKMVKRGVFFGPFCYYQVLKRIDKADGLSKIFTQKSTRGIWKHCGFDGTIESECLLPLIDSKYLKRLNYEPEMWLIAPLDKNQKLMLGVDGVDVLKNQNLERKRLYPHLHEYWNKCNEQYQDKRDEKRSKPILELNYGFKKDLEDELSRCGDDATRRKVVYNSSGNTLRAIRIPANVVANSKLYYILCQSDEEAQYLVGVLNAPIMQPAWRQTKTSRMHYHKSPLKSIPVPLFDSLNQLHIQIAHEIDRLEQLDAIDDFSGLNPLLKKILPNYTALIDFGKNTHH